MWLCKAGRQTWRGRRLEEGRNPVPRGLQLGFSPLMQWGRCFSVPSLPPPKCEPELLVTLNWPAYPASLWRITSHHSINKKTSGRLQHVAWGTHVRSCSLHTGTTTQRVLCGREVQAGNQCLSSLTPPPESTSSGLSLPGLSPGTSYSSFKAAWENVFSVIYNSVKKAILYPFLP